MQIQHLLDACVCGHCDVIVRVLLVDENAGASRVDRSFAATHTSTPKKPESWRTIAAFRARRRSPAWSCDRLGEAWRAASQRLQQPRPPWPRWGGAGECRRGVPRPTPALSARQGNVHWNTRSEFSTAYPNILNSSASSWNDSVWLLSNKMPGTTDAVPSSDCCCCCWAVLSSSGEHATCEGACDTVCVDCVAVDCVDAAVDAEEIDTEAADCAFDTPTPTPSAPTGPRDQSTSGETHSGRSVGFTPVFKFQTQKSTYHRHTDKQRQTGNASGPLQQRQNERRLAVDEHLNLATPLHAIAQCVKLTASCAHVLRGMNVCSCAECVSVVDVQPETSHPKTRGTAQSRSCRIVGPRV